MTVAEWVDAFDEAAWLGTPAPPRDAPAAWGPWDVHDSWWDDYTEYEALCYRNDRRLAVRCYASEAMFRRLRLLADPSEPIHYNRLGNPDVLYHCTGRCLGLRVCEREDPDPDRHVMLCRLRITGGGPAGSSAGRRAAGCFSVAAARARSRSC